MADKFDGISDRWIDDSLVIRPNEIPDVVYHYTDASGLLGVLRSGVVWATDYRFLNDKSEVEHTRQLCRQTVAQRLSECKTELLTKLYGEIINYQQYEEADDSFVFSLSEKEDDLSQWRGYAREGLGFTIGFSGEEIYRQSMAEKSFGFLRVEYDHSRQVDGIKRVLSDVEKELLRRSNEKGGDLDETCVNAAECFDLIMENKAVYNKHKSFYSEVEWRLVGHIKREEKTDERKVRASGLRLVRYIEWALRDEGGHKLPIRRIGIGPGFVGSEEVHAVKALCQETGYDPDIYFADTPYRRL